FATAFFNWSSVSVGKELSSSLSACFCGFSPASALFEGPADWARATSARSLSCSCRLTPFASAKPTTKPRTAPATKMRTVFVLTDDFFVIATIFFGRVCEFSRKIFYRRCIRIARGAWLSRHGQQILSALSLLPLAGQPVGQ